MQWPFHLPAAKARPSVEGPGLAGSFLVWAIWGAVAAATFVTNARVPVSGLYAVDRAGARGAAGRMIVLLGWPVALAAVAIVVMVADRLLSSAAAGRKRVTIISLAGISIGLCATIFLPGVVDPKDVDFRAVNLPAAAGVALAFGISVWAMLSTGAGTAATWSRSDRRWLVVFAILGVAALPWLLANIGFYAGDVPGLRELFMSKQLRPESGYPHLRAVHLGNHDGFDGLLLALSAVVLTREVARVRRLRRTLLAYLSLLLVYGVAVAAADWWLEQIKKRGWTAHSLPSVARPSLSFAWLLLLVVTALVWWLREGYVRRNRTAGQVVRAPQFGEDASVGPLIPRRRRDATIVASRPTPPVVASDAIREDRLPRAHR
jgi:hypothetical protein